LAASTDLTSTVLYALSIVVVKCFLILIGSNNSFLSFWSIRMDGSRYLVWLSSGSCIIVFSGGRIIVFTGVRYCNYSNWSSHSIWLFNSSCYIKSSISWTLSKFAVILLGGVVFGIFILPNEMYYCCSSTSSKDLLIMTSLCVNFLSDFRQLYRWLALSALVLSVPRNTYSWSPLLCW